jgi:hypothetical protein
MSTWEIIDYNGKPHYRKPYKGHRGFFIYIPVQQNIGPSRNPLKASRKAAAAARRDANPVAAVKKAK